MHPNFASLAENLHALFEALTACEPHTGRERLPHTVPCCAVYLFSEQGEHFYVGRTDRLRSRHKEHWSGRANDAPFAFKLARHATGYTQKGKPTRSELEANLDFQQAFLAAKHRVACMEFRWVEEADPNRQCLLEFYTTVALKARYNDFINH